MSSFEPGKHYLKTPNGIYREIPAAALKDFIILLDFYLSESLKELYRLCDKYGIDKSDKEAALKLLTKSREGSDAAFIVWLKFTIPYISQNLARLQDGRGNINRHLIERILQETQQRQIINITDIGDIIAETIDGKEIYNKLANSDFNHCREWLALPSSEQLLKICKQIGKSWKHDRKRPPFYGLIVACMIQAYNTRAIYDITGDGKTAEYWKQEEKDRENPPDYITILQNGEKLAEGLPTLTEKTAAALRYIAETESGNIRPRPTFTALNIGEAIRPTEKPLKGEKKEGKHTKGETREPMRERLEEIINTLQEVYNMPLITLKSIKPQSGHNAKAWAINTYDHSNSRIMEIDGKKIINITTFTGTDKYIFIDPDLLNIPGIKAAPTITKLAETLKSEAIICAFYYIALKITEARRAGDSKTYINKSDLCYLCGYDTGDSSIKSRFISKQVRQLLEYMSVKNSGEQNYYKIYDYYIYNQDIEIIIKPS